MHDIREQAITHKLRQRNMTSSSRVSRAAVCLLLGTIAAVTLLSVCSKTTPPLLPTIQTETVKELMRQQGKLEWFSAAARAAIQLNENAEQGKSLEHLKSRMPALPGHTPFSCWIQTEPTTGSDILYGSWHTGLTSTGLMVGAEAFSPAPSSWPRYRFERLTNGVYIFYISI